jgi:arsenite-transporting ATPase
VGGAAAALHDLTQRDLLLFGGKGGVGKTTIAAATAVRLAEIQPTRKTLLFSTDPAHSLADSLGQPVGDRVTPVEGVPGLYALEMDSVALLVELRQEYQTEIQQVFDAFLSGSLDTPFDRQVMLELLSLAPPGLDELMALMKIMDLMAQGAFDRYVLDLAPTGHALRFLEMPGMARQWFIALFKLLLKYQGLISLTQVAEWLRAKSKQLRRVEQILVDDARCQFVAVTIAEKMALLETARLLERLSKLCVPWRWEVVNMLVPASACAFCQATRAQQQGYLADAHPGGLAASMDSANQRAGLIEAPLFPSEVRGVAGLRDLATAIYGEADGR